MEEETVIKAARGDREAFAKLFSTYYDGAVRSAYLIVKNTFSAQDAAQEAFVTAYLKLPSLRDTKAFKAWFYKILLRAAYKTLRTQKYVSLEDCGAQSASAEDYYIEKEPQNAIAQEVAGLKRPLRECVYLYYYCGFSVSEIATITAAREGTVKSRLHSARQKLREVLEKKEDIYA